MTAELQDFIKTCELDGCRYVDIDAFRDLCGRLNISAHDADLIFEDLDLDNDGKISFEDFSKGFSNFVSASNAHGGTEHDETVEVPDEAIRNNVWSTFTTEAEKTGNKTR